MFFLNLTPAQFFLLFLPVCAAVITLYLYDRSRRRQVVSTLRFFRHPGQSAVFARRRKIRQPWSLILQLISLTAISLAVAQPQLGPWSRRPRDHVLILETSAWMNSTDGSTGASLMQEARRQALNYLRAIPPSDRVMLVRADQLATPVTPFTQDRQTLERAVSASEAGSTVLNLSAALELARAAHQGSSSAAGEIVLVGSGRIAPDRQGTFPDAGYPNLRTIFVGGGGSENVGIRRLAARRLPADPATWEIDVGVYNYGATRRRVMLKLALGNYRSGQRPLDIAPQAGVDASFRLRSSTGGLLEAQMDADDDFPADNRATVQLPLLNRLKIRVFTEQPKLWEPLFSTSAAWDPEYRYPREFSASGTRGGVVVLDGILPAGPLRANTITILPPAGSGSIRGSRSVPVRWNLSHPITVGVHDKDVLIPEGRKLESKEGDVVVAESAQGPVVIASGSGGFKRVVFGFHPLRSGMASQLAIPLLFANIVSWMCPEPLRYTEVVAVTPGLMELGTDPGVRHDQIRLVSSRERELPFLLVGGRLRFFAGQPGTVRISMPGGEAVCQINLTEIGDHRWEPPPHTRSGLPPEAVSVLQGDLWPYLALCGAVGLFVEWVLFGRRPPLASDRDAVTRGRERVPPVRASATEEVRS